MELTGWQVVVVEDTFDDRQLIATILEHYGGQVFFAKNGDECLALLDQVQPTIIVTDLAMPIKDGWQTLNALRQNAATAHIPVVVVTAYDSVDVAEDVYRAGFDGYFPKPVDPHTFVQRLQAIVNP